MIEMFSFVGEGDDGAEADGHGEGQHAHVQPQVARQVDRVRAYAGAWDRSGCRPRPWP
jgi:hypothetical protein